MNYDSSEIASSVHEDIAALKSTIRKISALQNNVQVLQEEFTERKGKKCSDSLIEKYINPEVEAAILAQSKSRLDEVLQVKNEIIQSTIESKKHLAVDKNCEKKMLLDTLGIGLNVVDIAKEVARVEFVIRSTKILVAFDMETKQFSRE